MVLAAVTQNGIALARVSEALKADREVVLTAVVQHVDALEYASPELRAEIKNNGGVPSTPALLRDYETADISFVTLGGDEYTIPNGIQQFNSINQIKTWLRNHGGIGVGDFDIYNVEMDIRITSILQLRECLFKFPLNEAPRFIISWKPDDE